MNKFNLGRWEIESMSNWGKDYIDLVEPGFIKIGRDLTGELIFGEIISNIDGRYCSELKRYDFSWEGTDGQEDTISGRGWIKFNNEKASGMLFTHFGDDSTIVMVRSTTAF